MSFGVMNLLELWSNDSFPTSFVQLEPMVSSSATYASAAVLLRGRDRLFVVQCYLFRYLFQISMYRIPSIS